MDAKARKLTGKITISIFDKGASQVSITGKVSAMNILAVRSVIQKEYNFKYLPAKRKAALAKAAEEKKKKEEQLAQEKKVAEETKKVEEAGKSVEIPAEVTSSTI